MEVGIRKGIRTGMRSPHDRPKSLRASPWLLMAGRVQIDLTRDKRTYPGVLPAHLPLSVSCFAYTS